MPHYAGSLCTYVLFCLSAGKSNTGRLIEGGGILPVRTIIVTHQSVPDGTAVLVPGDLPSMLSMLRHHKLQMTK